MMGLLYYFFSTFIPAYHINSLNCILKSGDGKSKKTAFKVNSVGEEYLIAEILEKNIRTFHRTSVLQVDGTIDQFSKGGEIIYFKVFENISNF